MNYSFNYVNKNFHLWKNKYCKSKRWKDLVEKYYESKYKLANTLVREISNTNLDFLNIPETEINKELASNITEDTSILDMKTNVFDETNYVDQINSNYKTLSKGWQLNRQVIEYYIRFLEGDDKENARNIMIQLFEKMDNFFRIPHSKQFMDSLNILNGNSIFLLIKFFNELH